MIILFKLFKVGDTIEAQAEIAKVLEIQIFTTKLLTASNQIVYIPNGIYRIIKLKIILKTILEELILSLRSTMTQILKPQKTD